jgi:hypothetical protein
MGFDNSTLGDMMNREWLRFKNVGSQDVPAHGVLEITNATQPRKGDVLLSCQRPGTTLRTLYVVNGPHVVKQNKFGRCTLRPCFALYTGSAPSVNGSLGPTASSFLLTTNRPGFQATGLSLSTPTRAQVINRGITRLKAKSDATITAGSSGTVSVWMNGSDSGFNLTAYLDWIHGGEDISADKKLIIEWFGDEQKWTIVDADCES